MEPDGDQYAVSGNTQLFITINIYSQDEPTSVSLQADGSMIQVHIMSVGDPGDSCKVGEGCCDYFFPLRNYMQLQNPTRSFYYFFKFLKYKYNITCII